MSTEKPVDVVVAGIAPDVVQAQATIAKEERAIEADQRKQEHKDAHQLDVLKLVVLPIVIAIVAGCVTATPNIISAIYQNGELRVIKETGKDNHTLLNSNMGVQLKVTALALERIAEITKEPGDIIVAQAAREAYDAHIKSQKTIDDKGK